MKKIAALALCSVLLLSLAMPAGAKNFEYAVNGNELILAGAVSDGTENVAVSVDGRVVEAQISSVAAENIPVTYAVLVDCSSALSNYQKQAQEAALQAIAARLRPADRLLLAQMYQSKLVLGSVLTGQEEISAAISTPLNYAWGVALYSNIVEILNVLEDEEAYPGMKCVIVLSDGRDDQQTTVKAANAKAAMQTSDIPVCGIGLQERTSDQYVKQVTNNFAALCSEIDGGMGVVMGEGRLDADAAAEQVMGQVQNRVVVKLNAQKLERSGDSLEIVIAMGSALNAVTVPADALPAYVPPVTEPPVTEPTVTEPPATEGPTAAQPAAAQTEPTAAEAAPADTNVLSGLNDATIFYALIGGGIAAIVAAVVILILVFRPREESFDEMEEADISDLEFMKMPEYTEGPVAKPEIPVDLHLNEPIGLAVPEEQEDMDILITFPACEIRVVSSQNGQDALNLRLDANKGKTFGRNSRANVILCGTDSALSGLHFELQWDGCALQIRDRSSTNGTIVNDVKLEPETWSVVANGDTIQAGNYRYEVFVTVERE